VHKEGTKSSEHSVTTGVTLGFFQESRYGQV